MEKSPNGLLGGRKTVNGAYRKRYAPFFVPKYNPSALPLGELSPKVTERVLHPNFPSPSSLRSDTSPKGRGKGCLLSFCICRGILPLRPQQRPKAGAEKLPAVGVYPHGFGIVACQKRLPLVLRHQEKRRGQSVGNAGIGAHHGDGTPVP